MKQVKLTIAETLKYEREVTVVIPDEMTEAELEDVLNYAERNGGYDGVDGIVYELKKRGITNPDGFDRDLDCPDWVEAECYDYEILD